jgi:hypothetical protein
MNELPSAPQVGGLDHEKQVFQSLDSEMLIYAGAGLGGLLIVVLTILVIRRKRRKNSVKTKATVQLAVVQTGPLPTQTVPVIQPPASEIPHTATPKFCPQCGSAFKQGAKFCGKCGFKTL